MLPVAPFCRFLNLKVVAAEFRGHAYFPDMVECPFNRTRVGRECGNVAKAIGYRFTRAECIWGGSGSGGIHG